MRVEGLIHCRRYEDAAAACEQLLTDSVDAMYLQAELRWRQNELAGAMEAVETAVRALSDTLSQSPNPKKRHSHLVSSPNAKHRWRCGPTVASVWRCCSGCDASTSRRRRPPRRLTTAVGTRR